MTGKSSGHPSAGMVVIGNEILTGKVEDSNSPFVCREMSFIGIDVKEITTIPDDFAIIGSTVRRFSEMFTWVLTSGGIGPTHDDITIPAIAAAFAVEAVRHPEMEAAIRSHYGSSTTEEHLLMAQIPEGSELVRVTGKSFGQVRFHNIFIMPGVPQLFRYRFSAIKPLFQGQPLLLKEFFLRADEGVIAAGLREVAERFPEVLIGSYPDFFHSDYSVKITLESRLPDDLHAAREALQTQLEALPITIVRTT